MRTITCFLISLALISCSKERGMVRQEHAAIARSFLAAIAESDYAGFVARGDSTFKMFRKQDFASLAEFNSARLTHGYEISFLETEVKKGVDVTNWNVRFKNGSPDATLTIGIKGGLLKQFLFR